MTVDEGSRSVDDTSAVFDALSDPRRRRIIHVLKDAGTSLTLLDLAREILRRVREESGEEVERAQTRKVQTALYHFHVPKLEKAGLVDFDSEARRVALADSAPCNVVNVLRS